MKYILINLLLSVWVINSNINLIRGQVVDNVVDRVGGAVDSLLGGDDNDVCGMPYEGASAEGLDPVLVRYPWISKLLNRGFLACALTKVSENAYVTAASCVHRINKTNLIVQSGIFDPNNVQSQLVEDRVNEIIEHPEYRPQTHENDLAVLKTYGSTSFNPVCIPEGNTEQYVDVRATVISFGNGQNSPAEEISVKPISTTDCKLNTKYDPQDIFFTMLCAPYNAEDKDACQGVPNGSPLHFLDDGRETIIGITSPIGSPCEDTGYPQVFTRITNYVEFIEANINN
ncbi:serine protease 56-like [Microplitis mediator]|uniref:serine protease 56-like n=1 Tax=Microplitis mediator TaxID=375433 RepID=UPI0025550A81|nr:serine protease 56-like [Microplitis mediator]XP_057339734.1 serine protease 56-like [Microplitis mediator]XP_057339735.1 serine protease 56-like [Microplitis mediator]